MKGPIEFVRLGTTHYEDILFLLQMHYKVYNYIIQLLYKNISNCKFVIKKFNTSFLEHENIKLIIILTVVNKIKSKL